MGQKFGVKGKEGAGSITKKCVNWFLGLDSYTPDYIVHKESGINKIKITALGCRAVEFEEKALKGGNRRFLIECMKVRERERGSKGWMEKREDFYRQNGFSSEGIKDLREREKNVMAIIRRNERDMIEQWPKQKIRVKIQV